MFVWTLAGRPLPELSHVPHLLASADGRRPRAGPRPIAVSFALYIRESYKYLEQQAFGVYYRLFYDKEPKTNHMENGSGILRNRARNHTGNYFGFCSTPIKHATAVSLPSAMSLRHQQHIMHLIPSAPPRIQVTAPNRTSSLHPTP